MLVSHHLRFVFVHVQRTAGTTLTNLLLQSDIGAYDSLSQHANARSEEAQALEPYRDYFTFGFTRNPWDRMLSWYSLLHQSTPLAIAQERERFEAYLRDDVATESMDGTFHYNTQDYFTDRGGRTIADEIYRYEDLPRAFSDVFERLRLPLPPVPVLNSTPPKAYQEYYTPESRLLLREKCGADIERFGYAFA